MSNGESPWRHDDRLRGSTMSRFWISAGRVLRCSALSRLERREAARRAVAVRGDRWLRREERPGGSPAAA
ncbi:MAG: hypothetical protein MZV70_71250 [Desulfobacterales bacterium]|nr:hypothetical protein [Desulfobacterales bacterium]